VAAVGLDDAQLETFRREGAIGPFDLQLFTENELKNVLETVRSRVLTSQSPWSGNPNQGRHLDWRIVYELCTAPAIVDRIAAILGGDLLLWQSNIFVKTPLDRAFPWHQDANFWPMEPKVNVSAWIALTDSTRENGCLEILPGSHKTFLPHRQTAPGEFDVRFGEQAVDETQADFSIQRALPLRAGQFFLFNERTLHRSGQNRTNSERIGLTARYTVPIVKTYANQPVIVVRGRDTLHFNDEAQPPPEKPPL
jgi:ectoine hydroxylase-related dioxygenase (phytanoyl-CoA dioxygenase family)